ncbi:MAG TPA: OsmC family protein [Cyclobacteriaceae bacterium]|nr:OsmC family protein [Cyclobacteriaceae bacterium]
MHSMTITYMGGLRTEGSHLKSGNKVITDAPPDNNGKGEAYSPTDLVCNALAACMMTLMGIQANKEQIDLSGMYAEITKVMDSNPRKIKEIIIHFQKENLQATDLQKEKLKRAALTCPVALSLSENLQQTISFSF